MGSRFRGNDTSEFERHRRFHASRVARSAAEQLIGNTQNRSAALMRSLRDSGFDHVRFVDGGMAEWARRGWPMQVPVAAN